MKTKQACYKKGNTKIHKSCNITCLPTSVCKVQCKGCYARRPELFRPNVLPSRNAYLAFTQSPGFVPDTIAAINKGKNKQSRLHESGDFYSQDYVNKITEIVKACPDHKFYTYTKTDYDFTVLESLPNFNLIRSITPIGLNYGDEKHITKLQKLGYVLCPCKKGVKVECMKDCNICLTTKKVCFAAH